MTDQTPASAMVLVPVEPTEAMEVAAAQELSRRSNWLGWSPAAVWSAMLAAAPPAPAGRAEVERLREAARHALTFIENRFSDLSPEKRATAEHLRAALKEPS